MKSLKKMLTQKKQLKETKREYPLFVDSHLTMFNNLLSIGFTFNDYDNKYMIAKYNNVTIEVRTSEDIYILNEIYYQGSYNFIKDKDVCVIDIGLNVGMASTYFAYMPNVKKVYAYEPFLQTYEQAVKNVNLNELVKNKLVLHNVGLGKDDREIELDYCDTWKGSLGINGLTDYKKKDSIIVKQKVAIKDVAVIFKNIIAVEKLDFVFKIDCEGAEYEILERLLTANLLGIPSLYMIEWHYKGCDGIVNEFKKLGYTCISLFYDGRVSGMVYAIKNEI